MARSRTFDPAVALTQVVDLFASRGYSETSMEDIVRATGVSRYGLYGTFGSKRELFEQALDRYADSMGKQTFLRLLEPEASLADIRRVFEQRIELMGCGDGSIRQGCLFVHTAMEMAPQDEDLRDVLKKFMKRISKAFSVGLETAQQQGEVKADVDVHEAGEMLTSSLFGVAVLGRSGYSKDALRLFLTVSEQLFWYGRTHRQVHFFE
jgi:TetR/AcrR family transcriptional repressor of nem operon